MIKLAAIYEGSRDLKDRTKKLVFVTNEVTPEQAADLQTCVQQFVFVAIKKNDFSRDEIELINDLNATYEDNTKKPSQRMRAVLYRLWEQNPQGYKDFNLYYDYHMNQFIEKLKSKLI